jgi:hypothetical protein
MGMLTRFGCLFGRVSEREREREISSGTILDGNAHAIRLSLWPCIVHAAATAAASKEENIRWTSIDLPLTWLRHQRSAC